MDGSLVFVAAVAGWCAGMSTCCAFIAVRHHRREARDLQPAKTRTVDLSHLSDSDAIQARGHALTAACALAGGMHSHLVLDLADQLLHYVTGSMTPEERASFARVPEPEPEPAALPRTAA